MRADADAGRGRRRGRHRVILVVVLGGVVAVCVGACALIGVELLGPSDAGHAPRSAAERRAAEGEPDPSPPPPRTPLRGASMAALSSRVAGQWGVGLAHLGPAYYVGDGRSTAIDARVTIHVGMANAADEEHIADVDCRFTRAGIELNARVLAELQVCTEPILSPAAQSALVSWMRREADGLPVGEYKRHRFGSFAASVSRDKSTVALSLYAL